MNALVRTTVSAIRCFSSEGKIPNNILVPFTRLSASSIQNFYRATQMSQKSADIVNFEEVKLLSGGANSDALIIDVREPDELKETGVIPRSINIPLGQLEHVLKDLDNEAFKKKYAHAKPDQDSRIIFSCRSGRRSAEAATIAHKLGYSRVQNYAGGWLDWEKKMSK